MSQQTEPNLITTSAAGRLANGMRTDVSIRKFSPIAIDEPTGLGGTDTGPNPMEFVMAALNGCVAVMIRLIAGEMNFQFEDVEFQADGVLDLRGLLGTAAVSPHFQSVDFVVRIRTQESEERLAQLKQQVHARCPALNLLKDAGIQLKANWVAVA